MKKEIGDLTLREIVDMCDNECDDCYTLFDLIQAGLVEKVEGE